MTRLLWHWEHPRPLEPAHAEAEDMEYFALAAQRARFRDHPAYREAAYREAMHSLFMRGLPPAMTDDEWYGACDKADAQAEWWLYD